MKRISCAMLLAAAVDGVYASSEIAASKQVPHLHFVLIAAPGSGKGTFAQYAAQKFGYKQLSVGDLLRAEIAAETELGKQIKPIMNQGKYIDEQITCALIAQKLGKIIEQNDFFVFDGIPPSEQSLQFLTDFFTKLNVAEKVRFVQFEASDDSCIQRIKGRVVCPSCATIFNLHSAPPKKENSCDHCGHELAGRMADTEEITRKRIAYFHKQVEPLLAIAAKNFEVKKLNTEKTLKELFDEYDAFISESEGVGFKRAQCN